MASRSLRSNRFRARVPKRFEWLGGSSLLAASAVGLHTNQPVVADAEELSDLTNPTLIRVRGHLEVLIPPLAGISYWAAGMIMVENQALLVGGWPDPLFDMDADWFWFASGLITDYGSGHRYQRFVIDSKAMRKIDADQESPQLIFSNSTASAGPVSYNFLARSLWQQV